MKLGPRRILMILLTNCSLRSLLQNTNIFVIPTRLYWNWSIVWLFESKYGGLVIGLIELILRADGNAPSSSDWLHSKYNPNKKRYYGSELK